MIKRLNPVGTAGITVPLPEVKELKMFLFSHITRIDGPLPLNMPEDDVLLQEVKLWGKSILASAVQS
jgi:hypothetical protein